MGYTHFYEGKSDEINEETFKNVVAEMARTLCVMHRKGLDVLGFMEDGCVNPEREDVEAENIAKIVEDAAKSGVFGVTFQGVESLCVRKTSDDAFTPGFGFCKTYMRAPVDTWIVALLAAMETASDGFYEVSSDGGNDGLRKGYELYERLSGLTPERLDAMRTGEKAQAQGMAM